MASSSSPSLFIPTTTASDLTPFPSMSAPDSGDNAGRDAQGSNGPSLASSASLYLYTFLATLVLLLSVSAAIVVRSYILRRRHRREIEEAIRNGTWIPPAAPGRTNARVDLSKKPRLWEAHLDLYHPTRRYSTSLFSEDKDWDSMKPLMVSYVNGPKRSQTSIAMARADAGDDRGADDDEGRRRTSGAQRLLGRISQGVRDILSTTARAPTLPLSYPVNNGSSQDVPLTEVEPTGPPKVSVAVLIAMPRQYSSSSSSSKKLEPSSSFSSPTLPTLTSATVLNTSSRCDDDEELPHIEMGVVELVVSEESNNLDDDHRSEKAKGRESIASGGTT